MLVKDLIERLQKFDENLDVVVAAKEGSETAYFVKGVVFDDPQLVSTYENDSYLVVVFGDK